MNRNIYSNNKYVVKPVQDFSIFTGFSCCAPDDDDKDLDEFIRQDAAMHLQMRMAVIYGLFLEGFDDAVPLGFATLQNDAIKLRTTDFPYKSSSAVKIGRFGINNAYQGNGIGSEFLTCLKTFMCTSNRTGCRFITLDAYNTPRIIAFYRKNGFAHLKEPNSDRKQEQLYFDLMAHRLC